MRRVLACAGATLIVLAAVVGLAGGQLDHGARDVPERPSASRSAHVRKDLPDPDTTSAARVSPRVDQPAGPPGRPRQIRIPALGVRAPVEPVQAHRGELDPPDDPSMAGWWRDGARPGAVRGSALITGHTVSTGGGVFDDLDLLRRGDMVTVTTRGGGRERFVVDNVTSYTKQSLARHAQRVFSQSVPGRLVLVTCEDWNGRVYLSNEVVTAVSPGS